MSTAIDKTLARVYTRIENREYYEAHQAVRTVVARYVRKKEYGPAIGLLYNSALLLAKANETGSAGDLLLYILKIYIDASVPADGSNKGRLAQIVWQLDPHDAILKQVAQQAVGQWAPRDADLCHVFGSQFARAGQIYEAENYLLSGTRDSAVLLADLHKAWSAADSNERNQPLYVARGVLGYLSVQNIRGARAYLEVFGGSSALDSFGEFLTLLVATCQTKNPQLYKRLLSHYTPVSTVPACEPALQTIERDFFGIVPQRQMNLMDLMGSFMK